MSQEVIFTVEDLYRIIGRKEVTILRLDARVTQLMEQNAMLLARLNGKTSQAGAGPVGVPADVGATA